MPTANRKIIHVDMDAFYTSVEQRDNPALRGKPVVVGGDPSRRGVIASASYEARKFGVRSAMTSAKAQRLCPNLIFLRASFDKYKEASRIIHEVFAEVTPLVEPLSLDEAYLDVTENLLNEPLARTVAVYLKSRIKEKTGLTASAGVGPNKFIAKIASDLDKPDGLAIVPPQKMNALIESLAIEKFWGVGPVTSEKLKNLGIHTGRDLKATPRAHLIQAMGTMGAFLHDLAHGVDERPVEPHSEPKSRGSETTFDRDCLDSEFLLKQIADLSEEVAFDLQKMNHLARTVTLKIKYSDFQSITRSQTLSNPTRSVMNLRETASQLLFRDTEVGTRPIRLVGVSASQLICDSDPMQLWFEFEEGEYAK